jgi:hypothetical protein
MPQTVAIAMAKGGECSPGAIPSATGRGGRLGRRTPGQQSAHFLDLKQLEGGAPSKLLGVKQVGRGGPFKVAWREGDGKGGPLRSCLA